MGLWAANRMVPATIPKARRQGFDHERQAGGPEAQTPGRIPGSRIYGHIEGRECARQRSSHASKLGIRVLCSISGFDGDGDCYLSVADLTGPRSITEGPLNRERLLRRGCQLVTSTLVRA